MIHHRGTEGTEKKLTAENAESAKKVKTITARRVKEIMVANDVCADQIFIADGEYVLPAIDWLRDSFSVALRKFFTEFRVGKWTIERNDCDDIARGAAWFAGMLHHRTRRPKAGLLFGEYWYRRKAAGNHGINCTLGPDDEVIFYEPQNVLKGSDPIVELSVEERLQCIGYRF